MAIFSRIKEMVTASINEMLDGIEDPETMINQIIREMDQSILSMRQTTTNALAAEKLARRRLTGVEHELTKIEAQVATAVERGDDVSARAALRQRRDRESRLEQLRSECVHSAEMVTQLKAELIRLEDKVQEARRKRETLLAKKRLVDARERMVNVTQQFHTREPAAGEIIAGFDAFEAMAEKIDAKVATLDAHEELYGTPSAENERGDIDAELAELKKAKQERQKRGE